MINRDSRGRLYSAVRGEILGFAEDKLLRKHSSRMFSLISERKLGDRRRLFGRPQPALVGELCSPATPTNCWGFRGSLRGRTHSQALHKRSLQTGCWWAASQGTVCNIAESRRLFGGRPRRYRRSLNHKLCRLGIGRCYYFDPFGTLREIKVFGFWGEYGRKAET